MRIRAANHLEVDRIRVREQHEPIAFRQILEQRFGQQRMREDRRPDFAEGRVFELEVEQLAKPGVKIVRLDASGFKALRTRSVVNRAFRHRTAGRERAMPPQACCMRGTKSKYTSTRPRSKIRVLYCLAEGSITLPGTFVGQAPAACSAGSRADLREPSPSQIPGEPARATLPAKR